MRTHLTHRTVYGYVTEKIADIAELPDRHLIAMDNRTIIPYTPTRHNCFAIDLG